MHIEHVEAIYPATPAQRARLAGVSRPAGVERNDGERLTVALRGTLDRDAFLGAWACAVEKHPALRTSFAWKIVRRPLQLVLKHVEIPFDENDWSGLSGAEQQRRLRLLIENDEGFDPSVAPLLRLHLCRLGESEHELIVSYHRLVLDAPSVRLVLGDVFAFYEQLRAGGEVRVEAGRAYADYVLALDRQDATEAENFGHAPFEGFDASTALPFERHGGNVGQHASPPAYDTITHRLASEATERLQDFVARYGLTLDVLLRGVWGLLLGRYTRERDVLFGAWVSGGAAGATDSDVLVGALGEVVPVHLDIAAGVGAATWLKELQAASSAGRNGRSAAFRVKEPSSEVAAGRTLFETAVVFEGRTFEEMLAGLNVREMWQPTDARRAMTLAAALVPELELRLVFDTRRFERSAVEGIIWHALALLDSIIAEPERALDALNMLTAREREQLLVEWNRTRVAYPHDSCFHQLFERQAERTPHAIAVECGDERLSYAELNARANQLAQHLRGWGVGAEVLVGVCVERSVEMLVAVLGVMKAGGAYVPLDPSYPLERLSMMLEDAQCPVLLTQERLSDKLPSHWGQTICVDEQWDEIANESAENFESGATAENLAYVIYTSGSTGRPKGTLIRHRGLVNYLWWATEAYELTRGNGAPVHSPLTFDLTVTSLFAPLLAGVRVVLLPDANGVDALTDALRAGAGYSLAKLTPAHLEVLNQRLAGDDVTRGAHALVIGGDALTSESIAFWQRNAPATRLVNEYGPTETVVGCCVYEVPAVAHANGSIPIGRPIANTQLFILDERLEPVAVGVAGELHVGGAGLARGYLNRPELTAERFIPDPYGADAGARLYRTGDLARYLADGQIEFLGRTDNQVKVRGFRVELGEIETVLVEHAAVREAAVVAREDVPGSKRLVAYLVAKRDATPTASELRGFLGARLPDYMIPTAFEWLDAMPLTAHGKVNRRELESRDGVKTQARETFVGARDADEQTLAAIWTEVLGLERVGIDDNFFELGGDSILGIKVIGRANQAGLRLTMDDLFECPTVRGLAAVARASSTVEKEPEQATGFAPLTPVQRWFFEQRVPNPHHWNVAAWLETLEPSNPAHFERVLERLVAHHDALRLQFVEDESGWRQSVVELDGTIPFERVDLASLSDDEQRLAVETITARIQTALDLSRAPLIRAAYLDYGAGKPARILIVMHHLATDGVSLRILLEDLATGYGQISRGEEIEFAPKTTSFKRWAERLAEHAGAESLRAEAAYWLSLEREEVEAVPVDMAAGDNLEASARTVSVALDAAQTATLLHEIPKAFRTQINDVLATALVRAYARWSGSPKLLVELEGHGREALFDDVDVSRTVGWFTSIFPVVLDVGGVSRPQDALVAVKEQLRRVPGRGVGYGLLRYLNDGDDIAARLRALPRAEISFNYLGQFDRMLPETSPFRLAREATGASRSPDATRPYLLEIIGRVADGRLLVDWIYGERVHRRDTVEDFAEMFVEELRGLVAECGSTPEVSYTPGDFPGAKLSQKELDKFIAKLGKGDARRADGNQEY